MSNIEFLRKEAGLTLRQLAERTGLSFSMISQLERGEKKVSKKAAELLSIALYATFEFIEGEDDRGIGCTAEGPSDNPTLDLSCVLSKNEYIRLKKMGLVYERTMEYSNIDEEGNPCNVKRFLIRYIKQSALDKKSRLLEEIETALQTMTEKDLNKVLVILRDVMEVM